MKSGFGAVEFKLCEMLSKTPEELGAYRIKNLNGYNFLVAYMVNQAEEQEKHRKDMERKNKSRGRR